jgi:hypothetical protein
MLGDEGSVTDMSAYGKPKTSRRAAPRRLTPEQRCIFTLGKVAERFVAADRLAREMRQRRNSLREYAQHAHDDADPCYLIDANHNVDLDEDCQREDDGNRLPVSDWCEDCRRYAEAYEAAVDAYYTRRSARQALTAAYRRLVRLREEFRNKGQDD